MPTDPTATAAPEWPTPRPWPAFAEPTPAELAAWLIVCTGEERVRLSARMLESQRIAHDCFVQDHARRAGYHEQWMALAAAADRLLDASHPGHCWDECALCMAWNATKELVRGAASQETAPSEAVSDAR